jgi:DNA-binding MarR family transcriptional regulator
MSYQPTSFEAYVESRENLNRKQEIVYNALKGFGTATHRMLAKLTGMEINSLTPRTGELVAKGYIRESFKGKCLIGGRKAIYWVVI